MSAVLTFAVNPDRKDIRAAVATGLTISAADFMAEIAAGRLGLWQYRMDGTWLGLPPDLLLNIFCLGYAVCLVWVAVERRCPERRHAAGFVLVMGFVLGIVAFLHNIAAERRGFIVFGGGIEPGTPLFAAGCWLLMTTIAAGAMLFFQRYRRSMGWRG